MRKWLVIGLVVVAVVVFIATQPPVLGFFVGIIAGTAATIVGIVGGLAYFLFPLLALLLIAILGWRWWSRRNRGAPPPG